MKRFITLFLALLILVSCAASCDGESVDSGNGTTAYGSIESEAITDEPDPTGIPPELKYDGQTFCIITAPRENDAYYELFLDYDNQASDSLNEAIFKRNSFVEERFNIDFTVEHTSSFMLVKDEITKQNLTDDGFYQCSYASGWMSGQLAISGDIIDLNMLEYVNFDNEYWDQNCRDALSIAHKNYAMIGHADLSVFYSALNTFFSKQMMEDLNIQENPYELVKSNEWTFDKMLDMMKAAPKDNGDGVSDENDSYGIYNISPGTLLYSLGYSFAVKDSDDIPVMFELTSDFAGSLEKIIDLMQNSEMNITVAMLKRTDSGIYRHMYDWVRGEMFGNNQIMFMYGGVGVTDILKNMTTDYGIVPNAKRDENQENYACIIDTNSQFLVVPTSCSDLEFTGAVLEYLNYVSTDTVKYSYIEVVLKQKRKRDEDMKDMLEIILKSMNYQVSDIFQLGFDSFLTSASSAKRIQSSYDKFKLLYKAKLDALIESINK